MIEQPGNRTVAERRPDTSWDTFGPDMGQIVPDDRGGPIRGLLWTVTFARVALVPVFVTMVLRAQALARQGLDPGQIPAGLAWILAMIALSDILDGWIARRFGLVSQAGAIVDALADKLVQLAFIACFTFSQGPTFQVLPLWFLAIVAGRDLALGGGWLALRVRAVPFRVVHRVHGRASTVAVFVVLFWVTIGLDAETLSALLLLTAALIWVSTAAYVVDARTALRASPPGHRGAHRSAALR